MLYCAQIVFTLVFLLCAIGHEVASASEFDEAELLLDDLFADTAEDSSGFDNSAMRLREWQGELELKARHFRDSAVPNKEQEQLFLRWESEFDYLLGDRHSFYFRPRFLYDADDSDSNRVEPYEAYLTYHTDSWDLRAGQFVENWGIADTYNPIDIINRRDIVFDELSPDRLGESGLRFRWLFAGNSTIGEPTLAFYFLPVFRRTPFPGEQHRFGVGNSTLLFFEKDGFEPASGEDKFYAIRFQSTLNTSAFNADVQFIAAHGPDRDPLIGLFEQGSYLAPVYFGSDNIGAGIRAIPNQDMFGHFLATLTLKLEVLNKKPYRFDNTPVTLPPDYTAYVYGFDKDIFNLLSNKDQLTLTLEYAGETGSDAASELLQPRGFTDDYIMRIAWQAHNFSRTKLQFRSIYDRKIREAVYELNLQTQLRALHEDLQLELQYRYFDTVNTSTSFFSQFGDNTSFAIGLRLDY